MQRRKVTFKLYPNAAQSQRLEVWTRLHCELYNAALEERIDAWRKARKSISYFDQQNTPGTGVAARPKPLPRQRGKSKSLTRETPTTAPQGA